MHIQLSLSLNFYYLYFLLNICDGNDATAATKGVFILATSGENRLFKTISIFAPRFQIDEQSTTID